MPGSGTAANRDVPSTTLWEWVLEIGIVLVVLVAVTVLMVTKIVDWFFDFLVGVNVSVLAFVTLDFLIGCEDP